MLELTKSELFQLFQSFTKITDEVAIVANIKGHEIYGHWHKIIEKPEMNYLFEHFPEEYKQMGIYHFPEANAACVTYYFDSDGNPIFVNYGKENLYLIDLKIVENFEICS